MAIDEGTLNKIEGLFNELTILGGKREQTRIIPGLEVIDASPSGLSGYIIIKDDRGEGSYITAVKTPGVSYANGDLVSVIFIEGTEPIAFQQSSGSGGSPVAVSKLVSPDETIDPVLSADNDGHVTAVNDVSADNFAFIVNNGSGAAANANDIGYIDADGDYQTTTTANLKNVAWCVVIQGGANGADIYVSRRGRATIAYAGTAPVTGDYLSTSTTAGSAQATVIRPEIFAVCLAAGGGGIVEALLMCDRATVSITSTAQTLQINGGADDSDFVSVIAAAGISGDKIYYGAISSGAVNTITPDFAGDLCKILIHNTTQVELARIIATGTDGTGNYIQVSDSNDISGWVATDAITARSQTNTSTVGTSYFYDLEINPTQIPIPANAVMMWVSLAKMVDTGAVNEQYIFHPFQASATADRSTHITISTVNTTGNPGFYEPVPLIQRRWQLAWTASGAGTFRIILRIKALVLAVP